MCRGTLSLWALALALLGCGSAEQPSPGPGDPATTPATGTPGPAPAPPDPTGPTEAAPTCEQRGETARQRLRAFAAEHDECHFDTDCVWENVELRCVLEPDLAVHSSGLDGLRELARTVDTAVCGPSVEAGCGVPESARPERFVLCEADACVAVHAYDARRAARPTPQVAAHNSPSLAEAPPRPAPGDADERARRLFLAIVRDEPALARDFYFPREAFLIVKAMADPGAYWDRLQARYEHDIHALHESTADLDRATFVRLDLIRRGGWVPVREEGNALPYWVSRHSALVYSVDGQERRLEVRVLITWDDRWYVTHLSEFH